MQQDCNNGTVEGIIDSFTLAAFLKYLVYEKIIVTDDDDVEEDE